MMKADKSNEKNTNYYILLLAMIIVFVMTIIMSFLGSPWAQNDNWRQTLLSLLGTIQASAIAFAIWELAAKRTFAKEVLTLADISANVSSTGIEHVYTNFLDINWKNVIEDSQYLYVVVSHGNTWRESNRETLKLFCEKSGKLRIFLPNFLDQDIMGTLDRRFKYEKGKTAEKINESIHEFKKIGAEIYLYNESFQNSYYVTDKVSVMSFFNHSEEKKTVPAIKVTKTGTLYKYMNDEINAILNNSNVFDKAGKSNEE